MMEHKLSVTLCTDNRLVSNTTVTDEMVKAVTTFGKPDVSLVAVSHRRYGYYVARMAGDVAPTLNGLSIGADAVPLAHNDVLELAGTSMQFLLKDEGH